MSAFHKYLKTIPRVQAVAHVIECLRNGESDNMAWLLMEGAHGSSWTCKLEDLPMLINEAIEGLDKPKQDNGND